MNRRDVIQKVVLGGAVLVVMPSVLNSCKTVSVASTPENVPITPGNLKITDNKINLDLSLEDNSVLNTAGGSKIIESIIVINTGDGNFAALSSICTHRGCIVGYDSPSGNIKCPCHGAVFTTSGSVVTGPATVPLKSLPVIRSGNSLSISL